ncbi:MAG: hypothetical protein ABIT01_18955 [Thermoanaerobaculia bacterium]
MRRFIWALVLLLFGCGSLLLLGTRNRAPKTESAVMRTAEDSVLDPQGRTGAESRTVARALGALPPGTRAALDSDALVSDARHDLESLYADYHPYFVRGDLDGDGRIDFAQAFVQRRNGALWFDVGVFFGRADGTFGDPVFVEKGITLAPGDLSIERCILVLVPDVSQDDSRRWRYEAQERRFVEADAHAPAADTDEDAPDETPDERPRARV